MAQCPKCDGTYSGSELCAECSVEYELIDALQKATSLVEVLAYCRGEWTEEHRRLAAKVAQEARSVLANARPSACG